jgi:hypothetical protein
MRDAAAQAVDVSAERDRLSHPSQHNSEHRTGDTLRQRIDELERTLKANEEESQNRCVTLAAYRGCLGRA